MAYAADSDPSKIDVGVGAYRDDSGKPVIMKAVQKVHWKYRPIVNSRV